MSNRCDYETFQQLISELEIGLDDYFISVEEIGVDNNQTRPAQVPKYVIIQFKIIILIKI